MIGDRADDRDRDGNGDDGWAADDATVPDDWATQLITFWFTDHDRADWFGGGAAFDGKVAPFAAWRDVLRHRPIEAFTADSRTAVAAVLLFDQVPRNRYRGSAEAFATDHLALMIAQAVIARGDDATLPDDQRLFVYLPFEHSEKLDHQRQSMHLITAIGNADYTSFAQAHFDIIKRFGRFPHRNAALGRADRPGEAAAVAAGAAF